MNNKLENAFAVVRGLLAKHKNKTLTIVAGVLVPATFVMAQAAGAVPSPSTIINCMVAGSCNNVVATPEPASETFGANAYETTNWISGDFSDDVAVGDDLTVSGDATIAGTLAVTGDITGEYLTHISQSAIVSVTTTQELCDMTNSGTTPRRLLDSGAQFGTQVTGETENMTVTSNFSGTATTGTAGTNLLNDYTWALSSASSTFSASSTAGFVTLTDQTMKTWDPGEHLVYMTSSPTTTLSGTCYAVWTSY